MARRVSFSLLLSCAVLSVACNLAPGSVVAPSPFFEVKGPTRFLVGGKTRFTAWYSRTGYISDLVEVPAKWSGEGGAIAVAPDGTVTALHIGRASVIADSEFGRSGTGVEVVPSAGGTWRGTLTITECRRVSGDGDDPCATRLGASNLVTLVISHLEAATTISGGVEVQWAPLASGWINGQVDSSGRVTINGRVFRVESDDLNAPFGFYAQLDNDRMHPEERRLEQSLTLRSSAGRQELSEVWRVSTLTRD